MLMSCDLAVDRQIASRCPGSHQLIGRLQNLQQPETRNCLIRHTQLEVDTISFYQFSFNVVLKRIKSNNYTF